MEDILGVCFLFLSFHNGESERFWEFCFFLAFLFITRLLLLLVDPFFIEKGGSFLTPSPRLIVIPRLVRSSDAFLRFLEKPSESSPESSSFKIIRSLAC